MIDVELASRITNSLLLGRQRKRGREGDRDKEIKREEEWRAVSWLKLKEVGSVCAGGFCPPALFLPVSIYPFLVSPVLQIYFAVKMAGALKACFKGCWQGVDQQKPETEDLLVKIQSDMFSLHLIGGLRRGGIWGWKDWRRRCERLGLFREPTLPPTMNPLPPLVHPHASLCHFER